MTAILSDDPGGYKTITLNSCSDDGDKGTSDIAECLEDGTDDTIYHILYTSYSNIYCPSFDTESIISSYILQNVCGQYITFCVNQSENK